jgi:hypothetical protein
MRRGLWTRLGVGIAAGLLLALALRLFIDPGQALTITDPNKSTTALSVRVLGVEVCQRDGPVEAAESFKAAARTWRTPCSRGGCCWAHLSGLVSRPPSHGRQGVNRTFNGNKAEPTFAGDGGGRCWLLGAPCQQGRRRC